MHPASPPTRPVRPTAILAALALALLAFSSATPPERAADPTPCPYMAVPVERIELPLEAAEDPEPLPMIREVVEGRDPFTAPLAD